MSAPVPSAPAAAETSRTAFSERSYDHLLERILSGALQPGDEINRRQVAEELGISVAPINEAITQLEAEGFVEVTPRRQTRVRVIRREEVRGLLILREAIECQAARLYCGAPVRDQHKAMRKLATAVDRTQPGTVENEHAECRFHEALVELVGSSLLTEEFQKVMRRRLFHKINAMAPWHTQPPLDNHQQLLEALLTEDPDAAEAAMRRHLQRGREQILK